PAPRGPPRSRPRAPSDAGAPPTCRSRRSWRGRRGCAGSRRGASPEAGRRRRRFPARGRSARLPCASAARSRSGVLRRPPSAHHLLRRVLGRPADRADNGRVAGAAADLARDRLADLIGTRVRVAIEQRPGCQHHPGRAEPALQAVLLHEALLHGVEHTVDLKTLDRPDPVAGGGGGEERAGLDGLAVHQNDAGATVRGVAPPVGSREADRVPQEVHEQEPRLDLVCVLLAVDGDRYLHHASSPSARAVARRNARCASSCTTCRLYSADPRWSVTGLLAAAAMRAASASSSSEGSSPFSAASASADVTSAPTAVRAMPARSTIPFAQETDAAAAATAQSPTRRSTFS